MAPEVPFRRQGKRLSLGTYPDTSLASARDKRDAARKLLAAGVDPGEHRKAEKLAGEEQAGNSFEVIARSGSPSVTGLFFSKRIFLLLQLA